MSYCPTENNSGFMRWSGELASSKSITINNGSPPVAIAFSPTGTIPTNDVSGRLVQDLNDSCSLAGISYSLIDIQRCAPLHAVEKSYRLPSQASLPAAVAELILTFQVNAASDKKTQSTPVAILFCLPIFVDTTPSANAGYLEQIAASHVDLAAIKPLGSLFTETEFGCFEYTTCFEIKDQLIHPSLTVYVFPKGIRITPATKSALFSQQVEYTLPATIRQGGSTMSAYTMNDLGTKLPTWSSEGKVYTSTISTTSPNFRDRFPYYRSRPNNTGNTRAIDTRLHRCEPLGDPSNPSPDMLANRCVPFTDSPTTGDIKNSHVKPGTTTLQGVVQERYAMQQEQKKIDTVKQNLSTSTIESILAGIFAAFVILVIYFTYHWTNSDTDRYLAAGIIITGILTAFVGLIIGMSFL